MNTLDELKKITTIVADSGDIEAIKEYHPKDATTNPSLLLKAASKPLYSPLLEEAFTYTQKKVGDKKSPLFLETLMDKCLVNFGLKILEIIPGRVSTEVEAELSFDKEGSIKKAESLIAMYKEAGIGKERVLIKLASTWEGLQAAAALEKQGIHCNLTLLFSLAQAVVAADAKVTLISPFVGRILDWYKKDTGQNYSAETDPGVLSVREIYHYYKHFNIQTEIMGASFRTADEVLALAGCDLLTVSPDLLKELSERKDPVVRKLTPETSKATPITQIRLNEKAFRFALNENQMATEKLSDGIRKFHEDGLKLKNLLKEKFELNF